MVAHSDAICSLAQSNTQVVSGCSDGKLKVWAIDGWHSTGVMASKTRFVGRMMTCYQYVVSGGSDGMLKVWDRLKLDPVSSFVAHLGCEVAGIAVWEGTIITVGTDDRRVRIHDMTPWLITAIDRVDMFYMWRVLKSITSTPARVEVALTNLVRHYRFSASVVFVEHFLTLGVPISDANLAFMRVTNTHERLAFLQYLDADGDGSVSDADLVTSLQVPLAAARAVLCRVMSVEVPPVGLQRAFQCPKLSTDALYARLAVGSLSLKRLVVAAGAHWLYSNRRVPGQCFRLFGVSGVVSMVTQLRATTVTRCPHWASFGGS